MKLTNKQLQRVAAMFRLPEFEDSYVELEELAIDDVYATIWNEDLTTRGRITVDEIGDIITETYESPDGVEGSLSGRNRLCENCEFEFPKHAVGCPIGHEK